MDTSVKPPAAFFDIEVDSVNKTPDSLTWLNDRVLGFDYSEAVLNPSVLRLIYPVPHPLLRTALGEQQGSFNIGGTEFTPEATGEFEDPDYSVSVFFDVNMDQTITPLITDFVLKDNGSAITITDVSWFSATELVIVGNLDEGTEDNVTLEFPTPTQRLRCVTLRQSCPFLIDVGFG